MLRTLTIRDVFRKQDLLALDFHFFNLETRPASPDVFHRIGSDKAYVVVEFPPQHVLEQVAVPDPPPSFPLGSEISGPTFLVFEVKPEHDHIPRDLSALLDWGQYFSAVDQLPSTAHVTAIELPTRLILRPVGVPFWTHSRDPKTDASSGVVELWQTRLGNTPIEPLTYLRTVRSIDGPPVFCPDPQHPCAIPPPSQLVRADLVSNQAVVNAGQLMLSSLGGWLDVTTDQHVQWKHRTAMGRDQYAREVSQGFLFPFNCRASLVKIVERNVVSSPDRPAQADARIAALTRQSFLVVQGEQSSFDTAVTLDGVRLDRMMPFKSVRITPGTYRFEPRCVPQTGCQTEPSLGAFWPMQTSGGPLLFDVHAVDGAGREASFSTPMIWVSDHVRSQPGLLDRVVVAYNSAPFGSTQLRGQSVDYVRPEHHGLVQHHPKLRSWSEPHLATKPLFIEPSLERLFNQPESQRSGSSTLPTRSLRFHGAIVNSNAGESPFLPLVDSAVVQVSGIGQLFESDMHAEIRYYDGYLRDSQDEALANQQGIFAQIQDGQQQIGLPSSHPAAAVVPAVKLAGISTKLGAIPGPLDDLAKGTFQNVDPLSFLADDSFELFGGLALADILTWDNEGDGTTVPKVVTRPVYHQGSTDTEPTALITWFEWQPIISEFGPFKPKFSEQTQLSRPEDRSLVIHGVLGLPTGDGPYYRIVGRLTNFSVTFPLLTIHFKELRFVLKNGSKPSVTMDLDWAEFSEHLKFISDLQSMIAGPDADHSLPTISVSPEGVTASYRVTIPPVSLGSFEFSSIPLTTSLTVPLPVERDLASRQQQTLRVQVSFADRANPFVISVGGYGGGGYFQIGVSLDAVIAFEGALEFGTYARISFGGLGSAGVRIAAGIFYKRAVDDNGDPQFELHGFVVLQGSIEAFGLISVSVDLRLALEYREQGNSMVGNAMLKVSVRILFFRKSGQFRVERRFAGSAPPARLSPQTDTPDFRFSQMVDADAWSDYASAFV